MTSVRFRRRTRLFSVLAVTLGLFALLIGSEIVARIAQRFVCFDQTAVLLQTLRADVEATDARLGVLLIPPPPIAAFHAPHGKPVLGREGQNWDIDYPRRRLGEILDAEAIAYVDATPALRSFERSAGRPAFFTKDLRLNAAGHEVVAEVLAGFSKRLLGQASTR